MATDKTYTVSGTSKLNGAYKVRFANDIMRTKNLTKSGHTDIVLVDLPKAMLKRDAVNYIATLSEFDNVGSKSAIMDYLDRNEVAPTVTAPAVKAAKATDPVAKKAAPAKAKAKTTEDEDAAF
jgi:hypothetical protein